MEPEKPKEKIPEKVQEKVVTKVEEKPKAKAELPASDKEVLNSKLLTPRLQN